MPSSAFLAVDWGTTNLRAWAVDDAGQVSAHVDFPLGVSRLAPGEAAKQLQDTVRPRLGAEALPAVLCGMVGSNLGWEQVPYLDCPADLDALARALHRVETEGPPAWIVPGLRCQRPGQESGGGPDVMRGEETQVLGWAAADPARRRGELLVLHPGTHAKWVRLVDGRVESFVTAMTGELFDVLRKHSVLQVRESDDDESAFDEGLRAAGDGGALAARLFSARARVVGGDMPPEQVKSYLSGLLIGAEVAGMPALVGTKPGAPVAVVGDPTLCRRYERALRTRGVDVSVHDGAQAGLAGLKALFATEQAR